MNKSIDKNKKALSSLCGRLVAAACLGGCKYSLKSTSRGSYILCVRVPGNESGKPYLTVRLSNYYENQNCDRWSRSNRFQIVVYNGGQLSNKCKALFMYLYTSLLNGSSLGAVNVPPCSS